MQSWLTSFWPIVSMAPYTADRRQRGGRRGSAAAAITTPLPSSRIARSPVQKAQLDLTKQPQSIPSIFALVNAKVGISQTTQSVTQRVTRGPGGSTTVVVQQNTTIRTTVYTSPLADQSKLQQYLPILLDKFSTRKTRKFRRASTSTRLRKPSCPRYPAWMTPMYKTS